MQRRRDLRPSFLRHVDLGEVLLSPKELLEAVHAREEWQHFKHTVKKTTDTQQRVVYDVVCTHRRGCPLRWHATYHKQRLGGHPAGTLVITTTGEHSHETPSGEVETPNNTRSLFTKAQLAEARVYMQNTGTGKRSATALLQHLVGQRFDEKELPSTTQLSDWMHNERKRSKTRAGSALPQGDARGRVQPTQRALEDWPQELPEDVPALYLLQPQIVSAKDVFVPFRSRGMRDVLVRYSSEEREVHLGVDTKMKVLERGHGVATLNILVKDTLRNTTLTHGNGSRVQGRAYTTRAVPFLQAVLGDEGTENHVRLLRLACQLWAQAKPDRPPLPQLVTQLHKDFAPGIEAARKEACAPEALSCVRDTLLLAPAHCDVV